MAGSFRWLTVLLLAAGLAACGGERFNSEPAVDKSAEGRAVKGVLQGARVSAYAFDSERQPSRFIASTLTDDEGYFNFPELPDELIRLVIEAAPDGSSTMLCDATDGCGAGVAFGQAMPLPENFQLVSLLPANRPQGSVAVTPLTHIAALWAEQFPLGVTDQTAMLALSQVAAVFALDENFAWQTPIDVTDLAELAAATDAAQAHGFLSAGFAQLSGGTDAQQVIAEYVQAFIDNGGQLPIGQGGGDLQTLVEASRAVAQRFAGGDIDLTTLIGSLQNVYTRWAGPLTVVSGSTGYDEAAMARAMAPLDDLDGYLRTAGIDEDGTFLASQRHQLDWLYTQHTLDLAQVSLGSALTVVQAAITTDLMLSQVPPGYPLPPTLPIDVYGMPGLNAVVTLATRQMVISGVHNGQTVDVLVDLAPLIAGLSNGELSYAVTASASNTEISGQLQGTLHIDLYDTDFDPLLSALTAAVISGGDLDSSAFIEDILDLLANLQVRAHIVGDAAIFKTDDQEFGFYGELDAWGEVNTRVLTAQADGPLLSLHIESGELVSPDGDRLFSLEGVPALHVDVGQSATLQAAFGFEAFGLPVFEVEADGELSGLGSLFAEFTEQASSESLNPQALLAIVAGLNFSVLDINGTAAIQGDGKQWQFTLDGLRLDATAANDTDVALSFFLTGLNGGYIYSGDQLVATVAFDWQNLGATIHFLNGESRSYFAGPLTDILPQELIDLFASLFGTLLGESF
ncbi:MAG: hypothetical protein P1U78_11020 [Alcanivoracaceae bacterium]|nr:hypothetical protein [Alcanivoracaceae bacterium]